MKVLSYDLETSIGTTIHGSTFRDPNNDAYTQIWASTPTDVHVEHTPDGCKRKIAPSLEGVDKIIGHNLGFDLSYMWRDEKLQQYLINGGAIWDTQGVEYLITGQQHKFSSLAELQLKHLNKIAKVSRISYLYKDKKLDGRTPKPQHGADEILAARERCPRLFKQYEKYCIADGATPLLIFKEQYRKVKEMGMLQVVELYNEYLLALINMAVTGIQLDVVACEKTLRDFNLKHIELLKKLQQLIAPLWDKRLPEFNINSPDHRSALLFGGIIPIDIKKQNGYYKNGNPRMVKAQLLIPVKGFGVPPRLSIPLKKDGLYATTDGVMQTIAVKTKNCVLKEYCELQKQATMYKKAAKTYCQAFIDRQVNGVIHANFNNVQTDTGRLSSSEPNLQNVARKNEFGDRLHSLFRAPPGWKCVSIDFSQLEVWCLALLSGDELLLQHLKDGIDFHCIRVTYFTDKTYAEVMRLVKELQDPEWIAKRSKAKSVGFSMQYGGGARGISEKNNIEIDVVQTILDKEAETYPQAAAYGNTVLETSEHNKTLSYAIDIPESQKTQSKANSKFENGVELLPIFDKLGNVHYNTNEFRTKGVYQTPTQRRYNLLETGRIDKRGGLRRSLPFTHAKNHTVQGTAGDIQALTTAALLKVLLTKADKIKMINEIHDSKWFYVRNDILKSCLVYLKETIENVPALLKSRFNLDIDFKFPVEIEVGDTFGTMTKYEFNQAE